MERFLFAALFSTAGVASAGILTYDSKEEFAKAGTVTFAMNFNTDPGDTGDLSFYADGGVQHYINVGMLVETGIRRNFLTADAVTPVYINIAGSHNMLAVNAASYGGINWSTFTVRTNLGNEYSIDKLLNYTQMTFIGLSVTEGETISSMRFVGAGLAGVNDIQIGTAADSGEIPEPATLLTLALGGVALILSRRRHRNILAMSCLKYGDCQASCRISGS